MPAEIQIKTDARTALSYFVKPLEDQFAKAFRER
jgi:HlyD family secretion protein